MKFMMPAATAAMLFAWASPAGAMSPHIGLNTQMFVEQVATDINGRERRMLRNADRVQPGDRLIFVMDWRNEAREPLNRPSLTRAVPAGTRPDLSDPRMLVSVDGGRRWGRIEQLWLPTPLGGVRRALPEDVTHVRWQLPASVPPGESGRISYRAVVR